MESRRPILIGVAQLSQRTATLETAQSPLDMLTAIAHSAAESAGQGRQLLSSVDTIALASIFGWPASNPPRLVADAIGAKPATEFVSQIGGETALALTNRLAERILEGESELGFVAGCNNLHALNLARKAGTRFDWPTGGAGSPTIVGETKSGSSDAEKAAGLRMPIVVYPLYENALRAARGQSLEEHRVAMGELFHPFTRVAAENPHAWFPSIRSAQELTNPTATNRMVGFPYPKYLNAVMTTDQAAGVLLASESMAKRLGIPEEKWIYWRGGAYEVEQPWFFSERPSFVEAPAMRTCHETALANAGLALDEIDLIDFYSCFPSAVSMACEMLGLPQDDPRGFTLTGGLPYAGGPGNSYSFHSLVTAARRLQEKQGENALVTGNGWFFTKHSATILSRHPAPGNGLASNARAADATRSQWQTSATQLREAANGTATVETYTVEHDRDGDPEKGIIIGRLTETNERFLANTPTDPELLRGLEKVELIGSAGQVRHENGRNIFVPA